MENLEKEVLKTALKKMFKDGHFSICTIDKCLKLSNTIPDKKIYENMSALHCINYSDMSDGLRKWLFENTLLMFNGNGFDLSVFDIMEQPESNSDKVVTTVVISEKSEHRRNGFFKLLGR
jgi:hypothetical protein